MCAYRISNSREIQPARNQKSSAARRVLSTGDFCERARVHFDGGGQGLAVNKLPLAAAFDEASLAQYLEITGAEITVDGGMVQI